MFSKKAVGLPAKTRALIHSWATGPISKNPVSILVEVLRDCGQAAYLAACEETLKVFRTRLGVEPGTAVHIVVRPGFTIWPSRAIRRGQDTIQWQGNARIHPLPEEIQ